MAAKAKKAAPPESESSSSSRSSSPESAQNTAEKSEAEESSSAESESNSSSESDSASSDEKQQPNGKKNDKPAARVSFQAPQPYKPPSGFKSVKKQSPPSASTASLLADLSGKQVYHITAPAFLPLDTVKELSLNKVMQGEPILKHKGAQYGIPADSITQNDTDEKTLFLYDPKTQTYTSTAVRHIQSYHVQQMVNLPERLETNDKVLEAAKKLVKPPRKQPKNLKMRFRPLGSGAAPPETLGSSSESEGEQPEPTFKIPKGAEKEREERKRKHHHTEGENSQAAGVPRKKSKKHSESGEKADGKEKSKKSSKSKDEKKRKKADKST
ncbi:DNA-directed RNA polymerase I subunit RPA34.5-domain-containing protein [Aspergillus ambiguus]|uniref:DNA-directed RNA polymerase I subunit RPA34 n=1 Tax=Aspergillus ambiguus TaxID=176160 RepID=UPI003CCCCD73